MENGHRECIDNKDFDIIDFLKVCLGGLIITLVCTITYSICAESEPFIMWLITPIFGWGLFAVFGIVLCSLAS